MMLKPLWSTPSFWTSVNGNTFTSPFRSGELTLTLNLMVLAPTGGVDRKEVSDKTAKQEEGPLTYHCHCHHHRH
jgi:hypothetical protein